MRMLCPSCGDYIINCVNCHMNANIGCMPVEAGIFEVLHDNVRFAHMEKELDDARSEIQTLQRQLTQVQKDLQITRQRFETSEHWLSCAVKKLGCVYPDRKVCANGNCAFCWIAYFVENYLIILGVAYENNLDKSN